MGDGWLVVWWAGVCRGGEERKGRGGDTNVLPPSKYTIGREREIGREGGKGEGGVGKWCYTAPTHLTLTTMGIITIDGESGMGKNQDGGYRWEVKTEISETRGDGTRTSCMIGGGIVYACLAPWRWGF